MLQNCLIPMDEIRVNFCGKKTGVFASFCNGGEPNVQAYKWIQGRR